MSYEAHALLKVVESVIGDAASKEVQEVLAEQAAALYTDETLAPKLWQAKDGVKKDLRQRVRKAALGLGYDSKQVKELSIEIEEMALKLFAKGQYE